MEENNKHDNRTGEKKSAFEYFIEILGWLQIVASPLLAGLVIGAIVYFSKPNKLTGIVAVAIAAIGLIIGIIWATTVWRKSGTMHFMSRTMATPELDQPNEPEQ